MTSGRCIRRQRPPSGLLRRWDSVYIWCTRRNQSLFLIMVLKTMTSKQAYKQQDILIFILQCFKYFYFFPRLTCPKIFSTGLPWKMRRDISSLMFWLSLRRAMALSMRTWCVRRQTFTRFFNLCKKSLFLSHVFLFFIYLGWAIYSGSPSDRSPLLLWFPDCNGKHSLWNVQPVNWYLHQRSQREVSYSTRLNYWGQWWVAQGYVPQLIMGAECWLLKISGHVVCWFLGCQHENIAVTELLKLCACLTSIYLDI